MMSSQLLVGRAVAGTRVRWAARMLEALNGIDPEVREFFATRIANQPRRPQVRPIVCVDECLNHPVLAQELEGLHQLGIVQYVTGCWYEIYRGEDGEPVHASRFPCYPSHLARILPGMSNGLPRPRARIPRTGWPDGQVMWQLIAQFQCGDGLFFLSANRRRDAAGVRRLLETLVSPMLRQFHGDRYRLIVLWKRGRTDVASFAQQAAGLIRDHTPQPGYRARSF